MIGLVLLIAFKVIAPTFKANETKFKQTGILSENSLDKTEKESEKDNFEQGKDYHNTCSFIFEHLATDDEQYHLPSYGNHYVRAFYDKITTPPPDII